MSERLSIQVRRARCRRRNGSQNPVVTPYLLSVSVVGHSARIAVAGRVWAGYSSAMVRFVFRLLATVSLAVAVILAVLDATRSVATSRLVLMPLGESWKAASPATLESVRAAVESRWPFLWDTVGTWLLAAPGSILFAVLALLLYAIGHRRRRRSGFAME